MTSFFDIETASHHSSSQPFINSDIATPIDTSKTPSKVYDLWTSLLEKNPIEPISKSKSLLGLQILVYTGALLARIPLIPLSLNFHPEIKGLGTTIACINVIAFSSFLTRSSQDIIRHLFYAVKSSEHKQTKSYELCRQLSILTLSIFSGLLAQTPYLFLGWNYNDHNKAMLVLSGFDVIPPIYSLNLSFDRFLNKYACSYTIKKIKKVQKELIEKLQIKLQNIVDDTLPGKDLILIPGASADINLNYFVSNLTQDPFELSSKNPASHFTKLKIAQLIGSILLISQLFWTALLSYQGIKQFNPTDIQLGFVFAYVIICNLALTKLALTSSVYNMLNSIENFCFRKKTYTHISERLMPWTSLLLRIFVIVMASASFAPAVVLTKDFIPANYQILSFVPYGSALFFMNYLPLKHLLDALICFGVGKIGSLKEKEDLKIYTIYKGVLNLIENSSIESLGIFLYKLSNQPAIDSIMKKHDLSVHELSKLIEKPA